jgi:DNA-binding PadR family transcriptional regulator
MTRESSSVREAPSGDARPGCRPPGRALTRLEPWLLLLLAESPGHGYELLERIELVAEAPSADRGHLYRSLRRLEREGLVGSAWETPRAGPARRIYTLTDDGAVALERWEAHVRGALSRLESFVLRCEQLRGADRHQPGRTRRKGGPSCRP